MAADPVNRRSAGPGIPVARPSRGFSLIELMVIVAIVAIIALVAMPGYQESVLKSRRSDGQIGLRSLAQRLERCYTQFGRYDAADCDIALPMDSPEGFYSISLAGLNAGSFLIIATPVGPQARDTRCGTLSLNSVRERGADGTHPDECR